MLCVAFRPRLPCAGRGLSFGRDFIQYLVKRYYADGEYIDAKSVGWRLTLDRISLRILPKPRYCAVELCVPGGTPLALFIHWRLSKQRGRLYMKQYQDLKLEIYYDRIGYLATAASAVLAWPNRGVAGVI